MSYCFILFSNKTLKPVRTWNARINISLNTEKNNDGSAV
jgi:hypothetical protein